MVSLILCGGSGTRLWPLSRQQLPKQFYPLFDQKSLFQGVIERNQAFTQTFLAAANIDQAFLAFDQLFRNGIKEKRGLIEPVGRNTAPAIALVAMTVEPDEVILVNPSDHLVINVSAYNDAVSRATVLAKEGKLVTFGIEPTYAETGYGYIEHQGETVLSFKEKPDTATAERYLASGNYLWNAGIFCFTARSFLAELSRLSPQVYAACKAVAAACAERSQSTLLEPTRAEMESIPSISIDYAVFEKSDKVACIPCDIGWSDLGSFDSLYPVTYNASLGNSVISETVPLFIDSRNNLVISRGQKKTVLIDVEDLTIVDTEDALLVSRRGSGQRVKEAVDALKVDSAALLQAHTTVERPWGHYTVLHDADLFKVKRIQVQPGHRISLQKHLHRQEHWVCVEGSGVVTLEDKTIPFERSVEVTIPQGHVHRVSATGPDPLVFIETQIGTYCGEDDLIRIEDDYKRS